MGEIIAPHGVRGEVRVRPTTDFPDRFARLRQVWLASQPPRRAAVERARPGPRGLWLLKLQGVDDRRQAESLRGIALQVEAGEAPELPAGSYYLYQVIGLPVYTEAGEHLGTLAEVLRAGPHDVYVVRGGRREYLIPAVRAFVDITPPAPGGSPEESQGRLTVRPIPGLLD